MTTTNLQFDLPTPGADTDAWGPKVNAALTTVDAVSAQQRFRPERYGAVGDGSTDDTAALVSAAAAMAAAPAANRVLWLTYGRSYKISLNSVALPDGSLVTGGGTVTTAATTSGAFFTATGTKASISFVKAVSVNDRAVLLAGYHATGLVVVDVDCTEATAVATNIDLGGTDGDSTSYANIVTDPAGSLTGSQQHASYGLRVLRVTGRRSSTPLSVRAFVEARYVIGGDISHVDVEGYAHCVLVWGGNASAAVNGALANERKAGEITGTDIRAKNVTGGGVWASMARDTHFTDPVVVGCGDVGLDWEGCQSCSFTGGSARDAGNACLATFSLNRNVTFTGVAVEQSANDKILIHVHNDTTTAENKEVTFTGITGWCRAGIGRVVCEVAEALTIAGEFRNVRIDTRSNNQRFTTLRVKLLFDVVAGAAFSAIKGGQTHGTGGTFDAAGCEVRSTASQPAGSYAIDLYEDDPTASPVAILDGVSTPGWGTTPIRVEWAGANSGFHLTVFLRGAQLGDGTGWSRVETAMAGTGAPSFWVTSGNHDRVGAPVPGAIPGSGYWNVRQEVTLAAPAAGGYAKAICTTAGSPGTWKNTSPIAA